MLHLHVAQQLSPITTSSWTSDLSPTNEKDAELNQQFPFRTDLKQNIARLTQVKNEGKEVWHNFSQYTKVNGPKAQSGSKLCSWLVFHNKS